MNDMTRHAILPDPIKITIALNTERCEDSALQCLHAFSGRAAGNFVNPSAWTALCTHRHVRSELDDCEMMKIVSSKNCNWQQKASL